MKIDKYIRTTYNGCEYITAYKMYRVLRLINHYPSDLAEIIDDEGDSIHPSILKCAHINGNNWTLLDTVSAGMSGWL